MIDGRAALRQQRAHRHHDQHAEQRKQVEQRERHEVVELGAELVGVEPAARPGQAVQVLLRDRRQRADAHQRETGVDDAAHHLAATERDREQLGRDADRGEREQVA